MENTEAPDLSGPVSTHTVLVEFTLSGYTTTGAAVRGASLMYADRPLGSLPHGVVDCRLVAVDGNYLPNAEPVGLRK